MPHPANPVERMQLPEIGRSRERKQDHGADECDEQAVEVEAGDARVAELLEQKAAQNRADDADQDVAEQAQPRAAHDEAGFGLAEPTSLRPEPWGVVTEEGAECPADSFRG